MILKIFIYQDNNVGEKKFMTYTGLIENKNVEIINDINNADYIFISKHDIHHKIIYPNKTIVIDYSDDPTNLLTKDCLLYFKRSIIDKNTNEIIKYPIKVNPISYFIKQECLTMEMFNSVHDYNRNIDISIFFEPVLNINKNDYNYNRNIVSTFINDKFNNNNYNTHIGYCGKNGREGRTSIQKLYYKKMFHSKIVVTCNPRMWEGDYRLYESIASGALVFVDKMYSPMKYPLEHKKHLLYYDLNNLSELEEMIKYYLHNENERIKIAKDGLEYIKKYHSPCAKVQYILDEINILNNNSNKNNKINDTISNDLKFNYSKYEYSKNWFLNSELYLYKNFLNINNEYRILEIGCYEGMSSVFFSDILLNNYNSRMICVDPFLSDEINTIIHVNNTTETRFLNNIKKSNNYNKIIFYKTKSDNYFDNIINSSDSFNFIYIDGSHEVKDIEQDMENSFKYLEVGGIMWMDDYGGATNRPVLERPKVPMNIFLVKYKERIQVLHKGYQLAIRKIK